MTTDVNEFITDLDGGVFERKLSEALSQVAASVVDQGKKGSVSIELSMKPAGSGCQVSISSALKYTRPTKRGESSEKDVTETIMHVGQAGALTFFPPNQTQLFDKQGKVNTNEAAQ